MLSVPNLTVSISGIRGFCPTVLSPKVAYAIIRGYMDTLPTGTVVVSRDARPTGIELKKAVLQAIHDAGKTIVDIDLLPLPTTQIYIVHSHSVAGIDITASHNPPEYNGLKLLDNQGNFLSTTRLEEIFIAAEKYMQTEIVYTDVPVTDSITEATAVHLKKLLSISTTGKRLTVAVDACNSAGSYIVQELLSQLECDFIPIATDPTKPFPRMPEPTIAHLAWTQAALKNYTYDVCVIVDPDSDRLTLIDEHGVILSEEYTVPLIASLFVLQGKSGAMSINQSTSQMIEALTENTLIHVVRSPVGEFNLVQSMKEHMALFGGEGSGGIIDPRVHYGRDALTGIVHIISLLRLTNKSLSTLISELPKFVMVKEKLEINRSILQDAYITIESLFPIAKITKTDGLRLEFTDQKLWVHIRPSNTEPIVRIIAEGITSKEVETVLMQVRQILLG